MAKWSGVGIPPTRKKLHRFRRAQVLQAKVDAKLDRSEAAQREASYRTIRRAIVNEERFVSLWCGEEEQSPSVTYSGDFTPLP